MNTSPAQLTTTSVRQRPSSHSEEFTRLLATSAFPATSTHPPVDAGLDEVPLAIIDGGNPGSRLEEITHTRGPSPSLMALVLVATLGVIAYGAFLLDPARRGDLLPYMIVVTAEAVVIVNALLAMWTILSSDDDPHDSSFHRASGQLFDPEEILREGLAGTPSQWPMHLDGRRIVVDVLITTYGEPLDVIRRTVDAAMAMKGAHRTWILDDGHSTAVAALAQELGVRYVRRPTSNGAKAGNVNYALTLAKGPFFAILDADFVPRPDMLTEMVPFFADHTVAFVQGPQVYGNMTNTISRGAGYM